MGWNEIVKDIVAVENRIKTGKIGVAYDERCGVYTPIVLVKWDKYDTTESGCYDFIDIASGIYD